VPRWDTLLVEVAGAEPVEGWANLLGETVGQQVSLVVNRDELPEGDLLGWHLEGTARLAGPDVVEVLPEATGAGRATLTPPDGTEPALPDIPWDDDDGGPVPVL